MSSDRESVLVLPPSELVERLDAVVKEGVFNSRSGALRYGAQLVVRKERVQRLHDLSEHRARDDVEERLERKRVS